MSGGKPILVTGAHRSGTTWVGRMLALAPGVGYIHEPFNPFTSPGISGARFERFYTLVSAEDEGAYLPHLSRTLAFDYGVGRQLRAIRKPADVARSFRDAAAFARARRRHLRPLVKDPIALLSAEWLAERFEMTVVVTIRHPAAFAGSLMRFGYRHDFAGFAADRRLVEGVLAPFAEEIRGQAAQPASPLEEAALLWRILYSVVDGYRARHPDWAFVRHEDASTAPLATFEELYARLGLELTPAARREIERHSRAGNPVEAEQRHAIRLDSAANVEGWRARLAPEEIARLRAATADVWPRFYSDDDW